MKRISFAIVVLGLILYSVNVEGQRSLNYGTVGLSVTTSGTGASTGITFAIPPSNANIITWQVTADGSALSVSLEGSLNNSSYSTIDTQTTATGGIKNYGPTGVKFVRCSQVSRTGGTATTCNITINRGLYTTVTGSVTGRMLVGDGSANAPSYSFSNFTDKGFYSQGTNTIGVSSAGSLAFIFNTTSTLDLLNDSARIRFGSAQDTIFMREAAGSLVLSGASGTGAGALRLITTLFAALGTPTNGTLRFCSDCTIANPCAGSGTGALAKRLNGVWVCN